MNCVACTERVPAGASKCPQCGRALPRPSLAASQPLPLSSPAPLPIEEPEITLDDEALLEAEPAEPAAQPEPAAPRPATQAPAPPAPAPSSRPPAAKPAAKRAAPRVVPPAIKLGITEIRTLVTEQPDLVEAGLRLYTDGEVPGASFGTPVGEIDLLARDTAGALVLLMVTSSAAAKDLPSELLPRLGYVRKHLAQPGQEVRAIVLIERLPEEVRYAAAALSDTVSFKTYRLALTFDDVAL